MKLLHTSDIQLDAQFTFLGEQGHRHREQLQETFANILDKAIKDNCDLLLIVGDLFNSNRPYQRTVDFVVAQLRRISIPVCILPGNHDCYESGSIYKKTVFPDNATIFTDILEEKVFPSLNLTVYGKAIRRRDSKESLLEGLRVTGETRWNVAMAHGNVVVGLVEDPSRPIKLEEIADSGMDYVALGDWHAFNDYSQGNVKAAYCGSPEPTSFEHKNSGYIVSATLDTDDVQIERVRIGQIIADQIELDVTGMNEMEIIESLLQYTNPNLMLEVTLTGLLELSAVVDPENVENTLSSHFYALRIKDQSHPSLGDISVADYPSENVIGKFIQLMEARIGDTQDEETRRLAEKALQVGVALLEGKEVV